MYLGQTILFMRMCEWSTARALLTKTIPSEEVRQKDKELSLPPQ